MDKITQETRFLIQNAKNAEKTLSRADGKSRAAALYAIADRLIADQDEIFRENRRDLDAAREGGMRASLLDRLALNESRLSGMAQGARKVAALPDPLGRGERWTHENGMEIQKIRVPLGVLGIIYEARPNVTADAAVLCLKSGNAVILRGGKEALYSNLAITRSIRAALKETGLPEDCVQLIDSADRAYTTALITIEDGLDAAIPRGGRELIRFIKTSARVPVIETGAGNCHVYVHHDADPELALKVLVNAKTSRPSVCNAAEHLLVHQKIAPAFLPAAQKALSDAGVELRGCARTRAILPGIKEATDADFDTEYNDLILSIKVVDSLQDAAEHINRHGTRHSEAILTKSIDAGRAFSDLVDAACVYINASTRFTDGEEFGFGAEIGISTQKLHARGPMGLNELTSIKYLITGSGQTR